MSHIDWLAVNFVVRGERLKLTPDEKHMAIRRLDERILTQNDCRNEFWSAATAAKLSAAQVAERMFISERSVCRLLAELPPADKRVCPVCREPMWVWRDGTVEAHPNRITEQCELSGHKLPQPVRGLAALRPDLYPWWPITEVVS